MTDVSEISKADRLRWLLDGRVDQHPYDLFKGVDDDFWLWANTEGREQSSELRHLIPSLPSKQLQERWTGKAGHETLTEGFMIYKTFRDAFATHGGDFATGGPVLDFGAGYGRVIRYFMKDLPEGQLFGTDHDQGLVDFSVESNPHCVFGYNDAEPPLSYADDQFGFLYAYSVFSHFSEDIHWKWLHEFKRIMKPGGLLALTVRPRSFIDYCRRVRAGEVVDRASITERMFPDAENDLVRYDAGEYCYTPYNPDRFWWGEACVPKGYVEQRWSELFEVVDFIEATDLKQHVVVLRA